MNYQRADMIELHDANTIIHTRDYSDALTGWVEWPDAANSTLVSGSDLSRFLRHYGHEDNPVREDGCKYPRHASDVEIELTHQRPMVGSGRQYYNMGTQEIVTIEVQIPLSPTMLFFRAVFTWKEEGRQMYVARDLTYCGAYTIWWDGVVASDDLSEHVKVK